MKKRIVSALLAGFLLKLVLTNEALLGISIIMISPHTSLPRHGRRGLRL